MAHSTQLSTTDMSKIDDIPPPSSVTKNGPTLAQFKEQIDYFEDLHKEVKNFEDSKTFEKWLRVSITPLKIPHKFFGLSVADLVMDLQLIKSN